MEFTACSDDTLHPLGPDGRVKGVGVGKRVSGARRHVDRNPPWIASLTTQLGKAVDLRQFFQMCIDVTAGAEHGSGGCPGGYAVKLRHRAVLGGLIITIIAG